MARKEAWSYCRRCLAVMLCCVLVSSFTVRTSPRAKATAAAAGDAGTLGAAAGLLSLIGSGVDVNMSTDKIGEDGHLIPRRVSMMDRWGYSYGKQLHDYLSGDMVDAADKAAWDEIMARFESEGGIIPGHSFTLPSHLAETIRQWAANMEFADGSMEHQDYMAFDDDGAFLLTVVDTTELDEYTSSRAKSFTLPLDHLGFCVGFPPIDFDSSYSGSIALVDDLAFLVTYILGPDNVSASLRMTPNFYNGVVSASGSREGLRAIGVNNCETHDAMVVKLNEFVNESSRAVLFYSPAKSRFYAGVYYPTLGKVTVTSTNYYDLTESQVPAKITTTFTPTGSLSIPTEKDRVINVPSDLPTVDVEGLSVPDIDSLTGKDLLTGEMPDDPAVPSAVPGITAGDITGAITDALPITGAIAGDQVVQDALAEPESLGAVFISKFPFSIPWDVVKAISLLAVPPTPPKFEFNMYSALEGYGGFHCDTPVVIDFEPLEPAAAIVRWASTLGFVYALAMGTKRLIWTA